MKKIGKAVAALTRAMDEIAGYFLVAAVFLIVANIVAGVVFNSYILGTYEYVGFLTAAVIGLSLGYCALQGGHIAVDFLVEKFPPRARLVLELITGLATLTFFAFSSWHIVLYGLDTFRTGEIAPTTTLPLYPFIFLVALGLLVLGVVILLRVGKLLRKAVER